MIREFPSFVTDEEADHIVKFIDKINQSQKIIEAHEIAAFLDMERRDPYTKGDFDFDGHKFVKISDDVTISKHYNFNLAKHIDARKDTDGLLNLCKLIIYLDEDPVDLDNGGTIFYDKLDPPNTKTNERSRPIMVIKRQKNKACIFDIKLPHEGAHLTGTKYLIGFRLLYAPK